MNTLQPEDASVQSIPIECFKVSEIEDDAVTLRNRPLVQSVLAHQIEESIALPTSIRPALDELITNCGKFLCTNFCSRHVALPIWSRRSRRFLGQPAKIKSPADLNLLPPEIS